LSVRSWKHRSWVGRRKEEEQVELITFRFPSFPLSSKSPSPNLAPMPFVVNWKMPIQRFSRRSERRTRVRPIPLPPVRAHLDLPFLPSSSRPQLPNLTSSSLSPSSSRPFSSSRKSPSHQPSSTPSQSSPPSFPRSLLHHQRRRSILLNPRRCRSSTQKTPHPDARRVPASEPYTVHPGTGGRCDEGDSRGGVWKVSLVPFSFSRDERRRRKKTRADLSAYVCVFVGIPTWCPCV